MLNRNGFLLFVLLLGGAAVRGVGQPESSAQVTTSASSPSLIKFDLDFPGGTPAELVAAIRQATGRPLNVIVQAKDAGAVLPAMQMKSVDVDQLFHALSEASREHRFMGNRSYETRYSFETEGKPHDASIWYFRRYTPAVNTEKRAVFFLLTPYLEAGLTVDDITTAVQTAWAMQGGNDRPEMSYHKETNLLIAVGDHAGLETISYALEALKPRRNPANPQKDAAPEAGEKS